MEEQWKKENMELWNSKEMREAYGRDNYRVTDLKTGTNRCYVFFQVTDSIIRIRFRNLKRLSCRKIGMIGNISQKAGSCKIVQTK